MTGLDLVLREGEAAAADALERLEGLAERRLAGEPIARIFGEKQFFGLDFTLSPETLVPRPETELLVETALALLPQGRAVRVLDFGTGTGCVAISILASREDASGVATDISAGALVTAGANAARHGVAGRLALRHGDWFEAIADGEAFDVVVSNPPYIESGEIGGLMAEVRLHDPVAALDGGGDGLDAYRTIMGGARRVLGPGGVLAVEIGSGQGAAVSRLMGAAGFTGVAVKKDLAGLDRVVVGHHVPVTTSSSP